MVLPINGEKKTKMQKKMKMTKSKEKSQHPDRNTKILGQKQRTVYRECVSN